MRINKPSQNRTRFLVRLTFLLREKLVLLAILLTGMIGLIGLWGYVPKHEPSSGPPPRPGSGIPHHVQVKTICIHPALAVLSALSSDRAPLRSHDALRRYLESRGSQSAWYAITTRAFAPAGFTTITSFSRPYESPERSAQLADVLATAAGKPPAYPGIDYSAAEIVVIPDDLACEEPREAIANLMARLGSSGAGGR
jgi:hypothetical protein